MRRGKTARVRLWSMTRSFGVGCEAGRTQRVVTRDDGTAAMGANRKGFE